MDGGFRLYREIIRRRSRRILFHFFLLLAFFAVVLFNVAILLFILIISFPCYAFGIDFFTAIDSLQNGLRGKVLIVTVI